MPGDEGAGHRLGGAEVVSKKGNQKGRTRAFENSIEFQKQNSFEIRFQKKSPPKRSLKF